MIKNEQLLSQKKNKRMNNYDGIGACMPKGSLNEGKSHHVINIIASFGAPI